MGELMRAMILERPGGPLQLRSVPIPTPGPGELLLRVRACAVCRTDLHVVDGDLPDPKRPLIPGHEIVGEVVAVGAGIDTDRIGERVGVPWLGRTCGTCWYCRHSHENLCDAPQFTGYTRDGGYAEYVTADGQYCFRLPPEYPDVHAAPLLCAGLIGYRSLQMAGDAGRLGIYGFGAAAHIIAQVAQFQGRKVFAFTCRGDEAAQGFARSLGAVWAGTSDDQPPEPLDAAIIFAPVGSLVPTALAAVRKGGVVVCAGIHMSDIPTFRYELLWGERVIRSVANLTRQDGEEFLSLAQRAPVRTSVTEFPLEAANEALQQLRRGELEGAAVLVPQAGAATPLRSTPTTTSHEHTDWGVVVYDAPHDPHPVAQTLVAELGLQPIDALIHARFAPGLLPERLRRSQAEALASRLTERGSRAEPVNVLGIPDLRHPHVSHHLRCTAEGVDLIGVRGAVECTIPWKRIALISAGLVPLETSQRVDLDDAHLFSVVRHTHHAPTATRLPPVMEAWLLDSDGSLVICMDQTRMNYESLGARRTDSAADNFRQLLNQFVSHAPTARQTPAMAAYLRHDSLFKYLFESRQKLQQATLLHWLILQGETRHAPQVVR